MVIATLSIPECSTRAPLSPLAGEVSAKRTKAALSAHHPLAVGVRPLSHALRDSSPVNGGAGASAP